MLGSLFKREGKMPLRIVVGLNQVDKLIPDGWDERLNAPTEQAEEEIKRRSHDIVKKLEKFAHLSSSHIEYYSAKKRYRLMPLLVKIVQNAYAGFKLDNVQPADPFELAEDDVREFVKQEREKRKTIQQKTLKAEQLFSELSKILSTDELNSIKQKFTEERQIPPKVAILGKAGVGKTTTVNSLFNAQYRTSHTIVGTTSAQMKEFALASGGTLNIVDLPGYGRSVAEDREYEKVYQEMLPNCDLVLLVIQADSRDFADDQEMLMKITEWLKQSPTPQRS
ncbi:hypothetical protein U14_01846 [Candidatus Moduliflexus flocculans]|uniref:G domain-containing protein n=1 Tax=Candidatus Moduliflexus flocculans TaxID=1499966 RepID=A0A0S6VT04_9BACT|nr:hypothetical protein U14_01846 [Candidatus Moduliflexus flocculans]